MFLGKKMLLNIHQKISVYTATVLIVWLFYEQLFHLILHTAHILFEIAEHFLHLVIEHFFEIGTHETQIVVFYLLLSVICYQIYKFYRLLPKLLFQFKQLWQQQKTETLSQWQELDLRWKFLWSTFFLLIMNSGLFLV